MNRRPLTQLPNGTWIDLNEVTCIKALPACEGAFGKTYPPRMVVDRGESIHHVCDYETFELAEKARDSLAVLVNAAR